MQRLFNTVHQQYLRGLGLEGYGHAHRKFHKVLMTFLVEYSKQV